MRALALCVVVIVLSVGCKTPDRSSALVADGGDVAGIFVGCAPSQGECVVSCPERNGKAYEADPSCQHSQGGFGCYCPVSVSAPEVPSGYEGYGWVFRSCVRSGNECKYSGSDPVQVFVGADPVKCPQGVEPPFACYHLVLGN